MGRPKRRSYRSGMTKRFWMYLPLLLCLPLAGCAHYHPQPLAIDPLAVPALQPPLAEILSRSAAAVDRPYLKQVALDLSAPLDPNGIAVLAVIAKDWTSVVLGKSVSVSVDLGGGRSITKKK